MDILLCTLNSTYQHTAFGLRYLYANLEEFKNRAEILEFTIAQNPKDIVEKILAKKPLIVGFGVYIWNTRETQNVVEILKSVSPDTKIVIGGPEVSHESEAQPIVKIADHTIKGEADFLFLQLCRDYFSRKPLNKIISGGIPDVKLIKSPYTFYSDNDIVNRLIYVEASRGCPFKCEYCLSSLDKGVRNFETKHFLNDIDSLITRGARQFKFVDRTFNLSPTVSSEILRFFLRRIDLGLFLHFEMVPDRLPDEIRELIEQFPAGSLQFEIGIQTFNPEVAKNVSRRQDYAKIAENLNYLRQKTKIHTHVDLIVGLPGESLESFATGFDRLVGYETNEIQVGILKRLKGFPLARHDQAFAMKYDLNPPFQILQNKNLTFIDLQSLGRFAKTWDLVANSGNFPSLMVSIKDYISKNNLSCFTEFQKLSQFVFSRHPNGFGISLLGLLETLWLYYSVHELSHTINIAEILALDYALKKRRDLPAFLKSRLNNEVVEKIRLSNLVARHEKIKISTNHRQMKHL